jgi:hypothetical protein
MRVALDAWHSTGRAIVLGVERIAVVGFNAAIEEIAITAQHTTAIGGLVLGAIVGSAFHEATEGLHRDLILIRIFHCENAGSAAEAMPAIHVNTNPFPNTSFLLCSTGGVFGFHQFSL